MLPCILSAHITEYPNDVPYVILRLLSAITGALLVSAVYQLMRSSRADICSSVLPAFLIAIGK